MIVYYLSPFGFYTIPTTKADLTGKDAEDFETVYASGGFVGGGDHGLFGVENEGPLFHKPCPCCNQPDEELEDLDIITELMDELGLSDKWQLTKKDQQK